MLYENLLIDLNSCSCHIDKLETDLFGQEEYQPKLEWNDFSSIYVSDVINVDEFVKWRSCIPVIICSPTGSGKNYMVMHGLREYTLNKGCKILYLSNRKALDEQQKVEYAKLTHTDYTPNANSHSMYFEQFFGNVCLMTYHQLQRKLLDFNANRNWFNQFQYVVIDECHFFTADAFFNPSTDFILEGLIKAFRDARRIYLSATPEDVILPILQYEIKHIDNKAFCKMGFEENHVFRFMEQCSKYSYRLTPDYSNFKARFFEKVEELEDMILKERTSSDKWVIFVTSIEEGENLAKRLNEKASLDEVSSENSNAKTKKTHNRFASFVCAKTRNGYDENDLIWRELIMTGKFSSKVLISTSVLDNGVSFKDPSIKNIVLMTDDRTEFLQELGRRRILSDDETVNVYIQKVTKKSLAIRRENYESFKEVFERMYGGLRTPTSEYIRGNVGETVLRLLNSQDDRGRKCLRLFLQANGDIGYEVNQLARWKTLLLGQQLIEYERLAEEYGENASIVYKSDWLGLDRNLTLRMLHNGGEENDSLIQFLDKQVKAKKVLCEDESDFKKFSEKFQELFHRAFPDEKINTGKNRAYWKAEAINNHLDKIDDKLKLSSKYVLNQIGEKYYRLEKR